MKSSDWIKEGPEYIANALSQNKGTPLSPEFILLQEYLRVALNRELIELQRKYQEDSVRQMRDLVRATWALVTVTAALVFVALLVKKT